MLVNTELPTTILQTSSVAQSSQKSNPPLRNPLQDADEAALFWMLGDAWYAQLVPVPGEAYLLQSSMDVGKREFEAVVPLLTEALRGPFSNGVEAKVATTLEIQAGSIWKMPVSIVSALAVKRGLVRAMDVAPDFTQR
jgi:hypothetical protein